MENQRLRVERIVSGYILWIAYIISFIVCLIRMAVVPL